MPHDGIPLGDVVLFTTTNGHLVFGDPRDASQTRTHRLVELTPDLDQLGWCRGVCAHPDDPDLWFVSFSKARRSKWRDMGFWIRYGHDNPQGRICLYDLARGELQETWPIGPEPGFVMFQLEALPPQLWI